MTVTVKDEPREMTPREKQALAGTTEGTRPGRMFTPPVDIFESDSAITVLADMPGVRADGLTIDLHENVLSIEGNVVELEGRNEHALLQEYDTGIFHRDLRSFDAHVGCCLIWRYDMPSLDTGASSDPLITGFNHLFKVKISQYFFGQVSTSTNYFCIDHAASRRRRLPICSGT